MVTENVGLLYSKLREDKAGCGESICSRWGRLSYSREGRLRLGAKTDVERKDDGKQPLREQQKMRSKEQLQSGVEHYTLHWRTITFSFLWDPGERKQEQRKYFAMQERIQLFGKKILLIIYL